MAKLCDLPEHLFRLIPLPKPKPLENRTYGINRRELRFYTQQVAEERKYRQMLEEDIKEFRFDNGHSLLSFALAQPVPELELIEKLIDLGASVGETINQKTPLHYLCDRDFNRIHNTRQSSSSFSTGWTLAQSTTYEVVGAASRLAAFELLIEAGASLAATDKDDLRPLDYCLEDIKFIDNNAYTLRALTLQSFTSDKSKTSYFLDSFFEVLAEKIYVQRAQHPLEARVHPANACLWEKFLALGRRRAEHSAKQQILKPGSELTRMKLRSAGR